MQEFKHEISNVGFNLVTVWTIPLYSKKVFICIYPLISTNIIFGCTNYKIPIFTTVDKHLCLCLIIMLVAFPSFKELATSGSPSLMQYGHLISNRPWPKHSHSIMLSGVAAKNWYPSWIVVKIFDSKNGMAILSTLTIKFTCNILMVALIIKFTGNIFGVTPLNSSCSGESKHLKVAHLLDLAHKRGG